MRFSTSAKKKREWLTIYLYKIIIQRRKFFLNDIIFILNRVQIMYEELCSNF